MAFDAGQLCSTWNNQANQLTNLRVAFLKDTTGLIAMMLTCQIETNFKTDLDV